MLKVVRRAAFYRFLDDSLTLRCVDFDSLQLSPDEIFQEFNDEVPNIEDEDKGRRPV